MGSLLERFAGPVARPAASPTGAQEQIRFVPARWLVILFAVVQLLLRRGALGKVGIAALLWSVAPRRVRLVAGGLAAAAVIVVLGALGKVGFAALLWSVTPRRVRLVAAGLAAAAAIVVLGALAAIALLVIQLG